MNAEIAKLLADSRFSAKFLGAQGIDVDEFSSHSVEDFAAFLKNDRENVAKVLAASGMKMQ